jgi:hypothetical protein
MKRLSAGVLAVVMAAMMTALVSGEDAYEDLLAVSPNGSHAFMSLCGPNPLTADPHVSTGSTPGVGVLKVLESGRDARFEAIAPLPTSMRAGSNARTFMR